MVFRVRDSGIGIPKNMLHSIFELFTQAERSLDRSQGGLGIGLTIVQRLVSMQGGTVEAFSDGPQKGSEFVVRLPRVNMRVRAKTEANAARDNDIPQRVLVVDDYADAAESMAALLRLHGHEVRIAHDGAARSMLRANSSRMLYFSISGCRGWTDIRSCTCCDHAGDSRLPFHRDQRLRAHR